MDWIVNFDREFVREFQALAAAVQDELLAKVMLLGQFGPRLARPHVDTLAGSRHKNLKELRFDADGGVWRVAFAFDPKRQAILLVAGDKSGVGSKRFYQRLIEKADQRLDRHLAEWRQKEKKDG